MVFTYTLPIATDRDRVRLYMRDTSSALPLYQDEELDGLLSLYGDPLTTAVNGLEQAASSYARRPQISLGDQKISWQTVSQELRNLAAQLRASISTLYTGTIYAGGIDPSELSNDLQNPMIVQPWFTRITGDDRGGTYPSAASPAAINTQAELLSGLGVPE